MDDIAFIALGSNIGDRDRHLAAARERIANIPGVEVLAVSIVEDTEPIGPVPQGRFRNQMIAVRTGLTPAQLMVELHGIEALGGRIRAARWGPRTIDLDIVKYARTTWKTPELQVPHEEIDNRDFWQRELEELAEVLN